VRLTANGLIACFVFCDLTYSQPEVAHEKRLPVSKEFGSLSPLPMRTGARWFRAIPTAAH
jgi:hypothetical protein